MFHVFTVFISSCVLITYKRKYMRSQLPEKIVFSKSVLPFPLIIHQLDRSEFNVHSRRMSIVLKNECISTVLASPLEFESIYIYTIQYNYIFTICMYFNAERVAACVESFFIALCVYISSNHLNAKASSIMSLSHSLFSVHCIFTAMLLLVACVSFGYVTAKKILCLFYWSAAW